MDTVESVESLDTRKSASGKWRAFLWRERGPVAMVIMAIAGIAIAAYLTTVHYAKIPLVCTTGGVVNCSAVTSSSYSVVPGTQLPITVPGMLWFIASGGLALVALVAAWRGQPEPSRLRAIHALLGAAGLLFVVYLLFAEIVQLHKLCEWCTVIHILTLATFLIAVTRWQNVSNDAYVVPANARTSTQRRSSSSTSPAASATRAASHHTTSSSQRLSQRQRSAARARTHNPSRH